MSVIYKMNKLKSTVSAIRARSVGKNILGGEKFAQSVIKAVGSSTRAYKTTVDNRNVLALAGGSPTAHKIVFDKFKENTQYTVQVYAKKREELTGGFLTFRYTDGTFRNIAPKSTSWEKIVVTSDAGKTIRDLTTTFGYTGETNYYDIDSFQIEEGSIATEYNFYKESTLYILGKDNEGNILELHSLPNGTKDEVRVSGGKAELVKRVGKTSLKGNEPWGNIITNEDNYQASLVNFVGKNNVKLTSSNFSEGAVAKNELGEFNQVSSGINNAAYQIQFNNNYNLYLTLPKSVVDTMVGTTILDKFKAYLNQYPVTLIYQLAEPIEIPIEVFGSLQSYENGTIYVDTIMPRVDFYTSEGIVLEEDEPPIKEIDVLYLVDKETGVLTSLDTSKAFLFLDGKGFTHPDLFTDALVDWDYIPDVEGTNPTILMKLPTNLKASVTSTLQGVQELSSKTKNLDTRVISNHRDIYNLQGDFVALQSDVFGISNELDTHKADYVALLNERDVETINVNKNGWTGTVTCVKNKLGQVFIYSNELTVGTVTAGTDVAVLPDRFKPVAVTVPITLIKINSPSGAEVGLALFKPTNSLFLYKNFTSIPSGSTVRFHVFYQAEEV